MASGRPRECIKCPGARTLWVVRTLSGLLIAAPHGRHLLKATVRTYDVDDLLVIQPAPTAAEGWAALAHDTR